MIIPSGSFDVLALNCLQKSMMFTPCGPSAVPTGGAGVALAAGNCNFTVAVTFLAMTFPLRRASPSGDLLHLREIQLDWSRASKYRYRNLQRAAVRVHVFHHAGKIGERPIHDSHLLVAVKTQLGSRLLRGH